MSSGPCVVVCMDEDHGEMNFIYWPEIHISEGLRFPLPLNTLVFTLYPTPPCSHPCEHYPHSAKGMCIE